MDFKISMKIILGVVLVALSFASVSSSAAPNSTSEKEMQLVMGEQRVISSSSIASFSESTRGVIEVKIPKDGRKMVITAVRPGRTSLLLINRNGSQRSLLITVFAERPETIEAEMGDLLKDLSRIKFRRIGPRVFVDGTVDTDAELERVNNVAALYRGQVSSLVQINQSVVRPRTNIRLDLTFIEMRSSSRWGVGINWPGQIGATQALSATMDLTTGVFGASYQVVNQALPFLEAAAEAGWVKLKKKATLITTSGNKASYSSGGEVNVAVAGSQAAELRTVPYGCQLSVLPRLDPGPGLLDLEVDVEVSDLSETSQDVPGRTISKVQTFVHLGLGQSIILSGLDAESESRTKSGLPGLSRIPILGLFFGVTRKRHEQVDGLIAITPTVLDNVGTEGRRMINDVLKKFESFDG